jgi:hypothetical protein
MTFATLLSAVLQYGPSVIPLAQKLVSASEAGRANATVTAADLAELVRLSAQTSADIYAREGIAPPAAPKA